MERRRAILNQNMYTPNGVTVYRNASDSTVTAVSDRITITNITNFSYGGTKQAINGNYKLISGRPYTFLAKVKEIYGADFVLRIGLRDANGSIQDITNRLYNPTVGDVIKLTFTYNPTIHKYFSVFIGSGASTQTGQYITFTDMTVM